MAITTKLRGVVEIVRPELPLAAGMCVVIGEYLALGAIPSLEFIASGVLCGFLLSGSAMATNDYFDLEVDRVNAPWRALPAGHLTPGEAMGLGLLLGAAGLAAAWALSPTAFGIALTLWILGFLYNWRLKASGFLGNLIVGLSVAMTFVIGGVGVGRPWNGMVWLFGLIAFVFDLAEEIAGDAMDAEGDRARGSRSLAIVWGKRTALWISSALFALMVALTWVPMVVGEYGLSYAAPTLLADALVSVFVVKLLRSRTPTEGRWAMRALYISASLGLLAFLVGATQK